MRDTPNTAVRAAVVVLGLAAFAAASLIPLVSAAPAWAAEPAVTQTITTTTTAPSWLGPTQPSSLQLTTDVSSAVDSDNTPWLPLQRWSHYNITDLQSGARKTGITGLSSIGSLIGVGLSQVLTALGSLIWSLMMAVTNMASNLNSGLLDTVNGLFKVAADFVLSSVVFWFLIIISLFGLMRAIMRAKPGKQEETSRKAVFYRIIAIVVPLSALVYMWTASAAPTPDSTSGYPPGTPAWVASTIMKVPDQLFAVIPHVSSTMLDETSPAQGAYSCDTYVNYLTNKFTEGEGSGDANKAIQGSLSALWYQTLLNTVGVAQFGTADTAKATLCRLAEAQAGIPTNTQADITSEAAENIGAPAVAIDFLNGVRPSPDSTDVHSGLYVSSDDLASGKTRYIAANKTMAWAYCSSDWGWYNSDRADPSAVDPDRCSPAAAKVIKDDEADQNQGQLYAFTDLSKSFSNDDVVSWFQESAPAEYKDASTPAGQAFLAYNHIPGGFNMVGGAFLYLLAGVAMGCVYAFPVLAYAVSFFTVLLFALLLPGVAVYFLLPIKQKADPKTVYADRFRKAFRALGGLLLIRYVLEVLVVAMITINVTIVHLFRNLNPSLTMWATVLVPLLIGAMVYYGAQHLGMAGLMSFKGAIASPVTMTRAMYNKDARGNLITGKRGNTAWNPKALSERLEEHTKKREGSNWDAARSRSEDTNAGHVAAHIKSTKQSVKRSAKDQAAWFTLEHGRPAVRPDMQKYGEGYIAQLRTRYPQPGDIAERETSEFSERVLMYEPGFEAIPVPTPDKGGTRRLNSVLPGHAVDYLPNDLKEMLITAQKSKDPEVLEALIPAFRTLLGTDDLEHYGYHKLSGDARNQYDQSPSRFDQIRLLQTVKSIRVSDSKKQAMKQLLATAYADAEKRRRKGDSEQDAEDERLRKRHPEEAHGNPDLPETEDVDGNPDLPETEDVSPDSGRTGESHHIWS